MSRVSLGAFGVSLLCYFCKRARMIFFDFHMILLWFKYGVHTILAWFWYDLKNYCFFLLIFSLSGSSSSCHCRGTRRDPLHIPWGLSDPRGRCILKSWTSVQETVGEHLGLSCPCAVRGLAFFHSVNFLFFCLSVPFPFSRLLLDQEFVIFIDFHWLSLAFVELVLLLCFEGSRGPWRHQAN